MNVIEMRDHIDARVRRKRLWAPEDFAAWMPAAAAATLLEELCDTGDLVFMRQGQYYRGKKLKGGMESLSPISVATLLFGGSGVGFTGLDAAVRLGMTTAPDDYAFAQDGDFDPRDPGRPEALVVPSGRAEVIPGAVLTYRPELVARVQEELNVTEVSTLEVLLDDFEHADDSIGACWRIEALVRSGAVRLGRIKRAVAHESPVAQASLSVVLRHIGRPAEEIV